MSDPSVPRLPAHASGTALPPPGRRGVAGWLGVPGVVLLPLRAFLGFTFTFAGAQKLANPNFFDARSPISIRAQMIASERVSPLHAVLGHLLQFSTLIGVLIALGELAVGIGTLLGIWTRLAALGGMVLSLTLFLTVSFHSTPYYTGADLVFLFAWTPLLVAGAGGAPALDTLVRQRVGRPGRTAPLDLAPDGPATTTTWAPPPETRVAPALGTVGRAVGVGTGVSGAGTAPVVDRRRLVLGGAAAAATGVVVAAAAGAAAGIGRLVGGAPPPRGGTVS
ncbi:MAG TPA: DoxX family protein, partial [Acidimicrobiales bacterium]